MKNLNRFVANYKNEISNVSVMDKELVKKMKKFTNITDDAKIEFLEILGKETKNHDITSVYCIACSVIIFLSGKFRIRGFGYDTNL